MRPINLLPPDERGRSAERFGGGVLGILLIAGAFAVIVMVGVYLLVLLRLNDLEDQVAKLDDEIARQNAHLAELNRTGTPARLEDKKPIADGIYRTRLPGTSSCRASPSSCRGTALDTLTASRADRHRRAVEQPLEPSGTVIFTGVALPRYENVADFVVRMDNLQYLANAELDQAALKTFTQKAVSFEVASELVTIVGENGTEVRLGEGSQYELAGSLETREIANLGVPDGGFGPEERYGGRDGHR